MSAGPGPGSETTAGRVNPKVVGALRAAAFEWTSSGSTVKGTCWTT